MERLGVILEEMASIVKREPQAVLTFNKFIQLCKEVQEQLRIPVTSFQNLEWEVIKFYPDYVDHVKLQISLQFKAIADNPQGYMEQENTKAQKYIAGNKKVNLATTVADDAYLYMENFIKSIEDQLFKDRLLDVFIELANGLVDFVERLQSMSEDEA